MVLMGIIDAGSVMLTVFELAVQGIAVDEFMYVHNTLGCGVISIGNTTSNLDDAAIGDICDNCTV
jgi:phosphosulfolactate synthase (CoM biosynthesis protein A)